VRITAIALLDQPALNRMACPSTLRRAVRWSAARRQLQRTEVGDPARIAMSPLPVDARKAVIVRHRIEARTIALLPSPPGGARSQWRDRPKAIIAAAMRA